MRKARGGGSILLGILVMAGFIRLQSQENVPTFRSEVALVRVDVKVAKPGGANIPDLTQQDFRVLDEGQPREIVAFERESDPLKLVLVLDVSASMRPSLHELAATVRSSLERLRAGDEAALVLFAARWEIAQPFTTDFRLIEGRMVDSIYKQRLGRETFANEALLAGAEYLREQKGNLRRAMVIVTDNEAQRFKVSDDQVIRALDEGDILLSAILVRADAQGKTSQYRDPGAAFPDVGKFAKLTGGDAVESQKVGEVFQGIVESIRTRYSFQYSPPAGEPGTFRKIRVELSPEALSRYPEAEVQARAGYYVAQ